MIGLEYILNLYGVQHQELAELLGIRKQNINLWIKEKQKISQKYLPILAEHFALSEEYFQKELNEIDRLIIQKEKIKKEVKPIIIGYEMQLSLECENEPDLIDKPLYDVKEMGKVEFDIEKAKVIQGFKEVLAPITTDDKLLKFQQLVKLFKGYGNDPVLGFMIEAISHYFNVLPDWVGGDIIESELEGEEPIFSNDDFIKVFMKLAKEYFG